MRMEESEFRAETDDGSMTTFSVHPQGDGPFPVAFLYIDGVGYREQIKDNARRFAEGGYLCVTADLFYRSGERLTLDFTRMRVDEAYRRRASSLIGSLTPDMVMADTEAVFNALATDPRASKGPRVCVGYCMGSRFSLHAAATMPDRFAAAAGIHPGALVTDQPDSPHQDLARVRRALFRVRRDRSIRYTGDRRSFPARARATRRERSGRADTWNKTWVRDG
jgi:carboxymethylenebutenolidase